MCSLLHEVLVVQFYSATGYNEKILINFDSI